MTPASLDQSSLIVLILCEPSSHVILAFKSIVFIQDWVSLNLNQGSHLIRLKVTLEAVIAFFFTVLLPYLFFLIS